MKKKDRQPLFPVSVELSELSQIERGGDASRGRKGEQLGKERPDSCVLHLQANACVSE